MIQAEEGFGEIKSMIDGAKNSGSSSDDYFSNCPYKRCSGNGIIAGIAGEKVEYCQCYLDAEEERGFKEIGLTPEEGRNYNSLESVPPPENNIELFEYQTIMRKTREFVDGFQKSVSSKYLKSKYDLSSTVQSLATLNEIRKKGFNVYRFSMLEFFVQVENFCEGEEKVIERVYIEDFIKSKNLDFVVIDTITNSEVPPNRRKILEELVRCLYNNKICTIFISVFSDVDVFLKYVNKECERGNEYLVSADTVALIKDMIQGKYGRGF